MTEELLAEGALFATHFAREFWKRQGRAPHAARLVDVRERIECFVTGLRGACPPLAFANPPRQSTLFGRLILRVPRHSSAKDALPSTDGQRVLLPRALSPIPHDPTGVRRYRLHALVQVERIDRGSCASVPVDAMERDLFTALDGAAVLCKIAEDLPNLLPDIVSSVENSAHARPALHELNPVERAVEALLRASLVDLTSTRSNETLGLDAQALREWVRERATVLRATLPGRYRGLAAAECWGDLLTAPAATEAATPWSTSETSQRPAPRAVLLPRRPTPRSAAPDDDERPGMFIVKAEASQQSAEDPLGLSRPLDCGEVDSAELADALSELPEARLLRAPGEVREILLSPDGVARTPQAAGGAPVGQGLVYPEWDYRMRSYRDRGAVVRELTPSLGARDWAERALRRHAALLGTVRQSFAQLRPRRSRFRRQLDGSELDIDAYVTAFGDRLAGVSAEDGLYEDVRPRRRELALLVLLDASASTDASIRGQQRIIDVEKEALLLLCKALEELGDRYAAYGFSGETAGDVRLLPVKRFQDRYDDSVERRIAGLEPDRYTRLGAALRHATQVLARERARHRLLLLVSDGKPNDVDEYEGRYGIEDTRQAVLEARAQHLQPFCFTVDRDAPKYARHVFGPTGYTLLPDAAALPRVLLEVLRRLVTR